MEYKILVCGTRRPIKFRTQYRRIVFDTLNSYIKELAVGVVTKDDFIIIHGACKNSADEFAQEWAEMNGIKTKQFPANPGNYLLRNIEMITEAEMLIAFWDEFSYGTAHTIAHAVILKRRIVIIT